MEKNERTLTRIRINQLVDELREALLNKDTDKKINTMYEIEDVYEYYKKLDEDG